MLQISYLNELLYTQLAEVKAILKIQDDLKNGFQMSIESTVPYTLVSFTAFCNLLPKFTPNQSRFARTRFSALGVGYRYLIQPV